MTVPEKIGRYEIVEEIGRGAMGAVYKARDPNIGRIVAIKTILSSALSGPLAAEYRKRFQREARAAGMLAHPGIVTVFDVDEFDGTSFLVMEFVQGRTLASALDAGERFPFSSIYDLGSQLADALAYAHSHGVIHRDVKPANILLTTAPGGKPDTMVKIADFGVAKLSTSHITTVQQMLGTPAFMSPEQCTGAPIDGRSDLFSLGVILYWMATGDKPFTGETLTALSYKIVHAEPIAPRALNPGMPAQLEKIILKCLAKSAEDRYASGKEVSSALQSLADPGTLPLRERETPAREVRPVDVTTPMLGTPPHVLQPVAPPPSKREPPPVVAPGARQPEPEPYRPPVVDEARLSAETVTHHPDPLPPQPARVASAPRNSIPHTVSPPARNYVPALLGLIGVLVVALLAVVFWPRGQAPAPAQAPSATAPAAQSTPPAAQSTPQPAQPASDTSAQPSVLPAPLGTGVSSGTAAPSPAKSAPRSPTGAGSAAPPRPTTPKRVSFSGRIQDGRLISAPTPVYPPLARQARIQDTVRLAAVIGTDGTVAQLDAISGHPLLIQPALDAVRRWRYQPAIVNGEAVEVSTTIDVAFSLNAPAGSAASTATASKTPAQTSATAAQPSAANPPATSTAPAPAPAASAPPSSTSTAPAKSAPPPVAPPPVTNPTPTAPPPKVDLGPPTLYGESSKATLRIIAVGIPQNYELLVFEGDTQLVRRLANARTTTTDFSRDVKVLPGQRMFRVVFRMPSSGVETGKVARARLDVRGSHTLTIEMRGTDDQGVPRFNLKLK